MYSLEPLEVMQLLREFDKVGMTERQAQHLVSGEFSINRIRKNMEYARKRYSQGKIENLAGFIIRAVENDYAHVENKSALEIEQAKADREILEALQASQEQERQKEALQNLAHEKLKAENNKVRQFFLSLTEEKQLEYKSKVFAKLNGIQKRILEGKTLVELANHGEFIRNLKQIVTV